MRKRGLALFMSAVMALSGGMTARAAAMGDEEIEITEEVEDIDISSLEDSGTFASDTAEEESIDIVEEQESEEITVAEDEDAGQDTLSDLYKNKKQYRTENLPSLRNQGKYGSSR